MLAITRFWADERRSWRWRDGLALGVVLACGAMIFGAVALAETKSSGAAEPAVEKPAPAYVLLMIARDPAVHEELKLDARQAEQVAAAVDEVDHPLWLLRDVAVDKSGEQLERLAEKFRGRLQNGLTAAQSRRLEEIILQARGTKALVSPELMRRLEISDAQAAKIRGALATPDAAAKGRDTKLASATGDAARGGSAKGVLDLLSPEQSNRLSEMTGKPFDLERVLQIGCQAPDVRSVPSWINSKPLALESLRGRVVAVHFWAFECSNCIQNLPHYQSWYEKFPKSQFTIIGMHTPETANEKSLANLRRNVHQRDIKYPVAFDSASENWKAWGNNVWPSVYLIDKQGRVRNWWYGELNWQGATGEEFMRKKIAALLSEP